MTSIKDLSAYKGVWVFIEQVEGKVTSLSLEILGEGRKLANKLGSRLTAVVMGHNLAKSASDLIAYGADTVLVADAPVLAHYRTELYTQILCAEAETRKPDILLVGASATGRDLAPRISFRLKTGCTADCTELDIDEEKKILVSTRPAFGGNVMATILCPDHRPQMSTVRPGVMALPVRDDSRTGEVIAIDVTVEEKDARVKILEVKQHQGASVNIQEAVRVVSAGMGACSGECFASLKELARELDAEIGGTRPFFESGLISHDVQIGQTGKTVRPELYLAVGISGTVQHTTGMNNSRTVVAINKDPNAEIFKFAHYGIVGDAKVVVPALIEQLKASRE